MINGGCANCGVVLALLEGGTYGVWYKCFIGQFMSDASWFNYLYS